MLKYLDVLIFVIYPFQLEHISHQTEVEHGSGSGGGGSGSVKSDDGAESDASGITVTANNNNKELRHKVTGEHDEAEEHRSFPTLIEAFQNVSEEVGFNVELKYPMTLQVDGISLEKINVLNIKTE